MVSLHEQDPFLVVWRHEVVQFYIALGLPFWMGFHVQAQRLPLKDTRNVKYPACWVWP